MKNLIIKHVRVDYSYYRNLGDNGGAQVVFASKSFGDGKLFSKREIKKMIRDWFVEWRGKGYITINWIDCAGEFYPSEKPIQLKEWEDTFAGKIIKFNSFS